MVYFTLNKKHKTNRSGYKKTKYNIQLKFKYKSNILRITSQISTNIPNIFQFFRHREKKIKSQGSLAHFSHVSGYFDRCLINL